MRSIRKSIPDSMVRVERQVLTFANTSEGMKERCIGVAKILRRLEPRPSGNLTVREPEPILQS